MPERIMVIYSNMTATYGKNHIDFFFPEDFIRVFVQWHASMYRSVVNKNFLSDNGLFCTERNALFCK